MAPKRPYIVNDYRANAKNLETILGPLESRTMDAIWSMPKKEVTVREVHTKLSKEERSAYTTVMSTMNTLYQKGLLDRKIEKGRGGLMYVYSPRFARKNFERSAVRQVIDSLTRNFGDSVASYLIERAASSSANRDLVKEVLSEKLGRRSRRRR